MRPLAFFDRLKPDHTPSDTDHPHAEDDEKAPHVSDYRSSGESSQERLTEDAQAGVQNIEATTAVWTKKALIIAYSMSVN